jgi:hypothetical protein
VPQRCIADQPGRARDHHLLCHRLAPPIHIHPAAIDPRRKQNKKAPEKSPGLFACPFPDDQFWLSPMIGVSLS